MKIFKKLLSLILVCAILAMSLSVGFSAIAAATDIVTGDANGKAYILGDTIYSTDFEDETLGSMPEGWEMNSASFGYTGGGEASAVVAEFGSYGNALKFSSTGIDTWMSMPEIKTRNYVYEATFVVGEDTTTGASFGIANGMYGGISTATGATYTVVYVKSTANNTESHYRSKGSPSVTKENFTTPIKTPVGTTVKMKFVSLSGKNYLYINDTYIGAYAQGDSDSTSDWAGLFIYRGTFYITDVNVTEIVKTETVLNNVTISTDDNVDINVELSFDKNNKIYKNNISGNYAYSDTAPIKFGVLSTVSDTSAITAPTIETAGVTDYLFKTNTYDLNKLYFNYTESVPTENLDKYYTFRPYVLIGDTYIYGDAKSYCPASIADNIYSSGSDEMKAKLNSAFANSSVFKGENAKTLTFTMFSDFHYKQGMYIQRVSDLETILKRAEDSSSAFIMSGGDFCNDFAGSPELINTYLNYTKADGSLLPAYNIYGNHELETTGNTMENVTPTLTNDENVVWGTEDGSYDCNIAYYYFEVNGFRIVCTDTNYSYDKTNDVWEHNEPASYGNPSGNIYNNSLGPTQLSWLEDVLTDAANKSIPCIVISHHGFSGEFSTSCYDATAIREIYARVNAIKAGTVIMSINGHHHTNNQGYVDGVFYYDVNTGRNGYYDGGQSSTSYHYSDDATYLYEEYDEEGNLTNSYQKKINSLWMSHFTWWFAEPLSSVVTVSETGAVTIDGEETEWLYGLEPPTTDPSVTPSITSGDFWDCDSLGHIWSNEWDYNEEYHWHSCKNPACSVKDVSLNDSYAAHTFKEVESEEFLVEGTTSLYYESCECGAISNKTFGEGEIPIAQKVWDGSIADSYAGGDGSADSPYLIENASQLARMIGYDVLTNYTTTSQNGSTDKYYKLMADIYINDVSLSDWYNGENLNVWYSGINSRFAGNFDGNGHTVYGLYFGENATNAGLIPIIDFWNNSRVIENITVSDSYIIASQFAGGITSRFYGANQNTIDFNNCYITESVIINATTIQANGWTPWCGGISGFSSTGDTTIINVSNSASLASDINGSPLNFGLVGVNLNWSAKLYLTINNSFAYAEDWQGITLKGSITNSYLISDLSDIKGEKAKTTLANIEGFYFTKGYPLNTAIGQLMGDANGDNSCNSLDLTVMRKYLLGVSECPLSDINADGESDVRDLVNLKKKLSERNN